MILIIIFKFQLAPNKGESLNMPDHIDNFPSIHLQIIRVEVIKTWEKTRSASECMYLKLTTLSERGLWVLHSPRDYMYTLPPLLASS